MFNTYSETETMDSFYTEISHSIDHQLNYKFEDDEFHEHIISFKDLFDLVHYIESYWTEDFLKKVLAFQNAEEANSEPHEPQEPGSKRQKIDNQ